MTRNVTKDSAKAADFIRSYMTNVEEITAAAFISSEIKRHFDLRESHVRSLLKRNKELSSKYRDSREQSSRKNKEMPPWYEPTEKGMRFIPGILATNISQNINAFYGAEEFYLYAI